MGDAFKDAGPGERSVYDRTGLPEVAAIARMGAGDGLVERVEDLIFSGRRRADEAEALVDSYAFNQAWAAEALNALEIALRGYRTTANAMTELLAHIAALTAQVAEKEEQLVSVLRREAATQQRHDAKMEAAEAERDALRAKVARLEGAIDYILDGMAISAPEYAIDPDDDFLDAANADWVRDTLSRLAAALTDGGKDG